MRNSSHRALSLVVLVLVSVIPVPAESAQILEEIIVTAQKRAESLSDVPISLSVLSGSQIDDSGIRRAEDLSEYIPNFSVTQGPVSDKINIRGIQSGNQTGFEQSVATFVDDIYRGRGTQTRWSFLDIERVEVLRGPQPILFGINTVAGAISISTARPTPDLAAQISAKYNLEFDEAEYQAFFSGPITDRFSGRIAVLNRVMNNGWVFNRHYVEDNPASKENFGRASFEWELASETVLSFKYENGNFDITGQPWVISEGGPISPFLQAAGVSVGRVFETDIGNSGFPLLGIPGDPVIDFGSASLFEGDSEEVVAKIEHTLANETRITGIAGYSAYAFERSFDADVNPLPVVRFDDNEDFDQVSLEFRLASDNGGPIEYIAGLYYQDNEMFVDTLAQFNLSAIDVLLSGTCAGLPGGPGSVTPGDVIATAVSVASLPGATAGVTNACAQTALTQALVPAGVNGAGRYTYLDQGAESLATFGQVSWQMTDAVRGSLGLRYTLQDKEASQGAHATVYESRNTTALADQSPANPSALAAFLIGEFTPHAFVPTDPGMTRDEDSLTWSISTQWDVNSNSMLYASAATGYKAGGFNSAFAGQAQATGADSLDIAFEEEDVLTFELGGKMTVLDGAGALNFAVFHTEYEDLQVSVFSGNTTFIVQNAAEATSQGVEVDFRWQASDNLKLRMALGWLDFAYDKFRNQGCVAEQFLNFREQNFQNALSEGDPVTAGISSLVINNQSCASAGINDMRGRQSAHSPEWTATLVAEHSAQLGGYEMKTALDLKWSDEVYRQDDLDPFSLQGTYLKLNAFIMLNPTDGNWDLSLMAQNLTDEVTFTYVNDMPLFDGARISRMDQPRNFSIRARYHF